MTRTSLQLALAAAAAASGAVLVAAAGAPLRTALPAAALAWLVLASTAAAAHRAVSVRRLAERPRAAGLRAQMAAVGALRSVAEGGPGLAAAWGAYPALEAAVLFGPAAPQPAGAARDRLEARVRADLARCPDGALRAVASGLGEVTDACLEAAASPLHPLHPVATSTLRELGEIDGRPFADLRAAARRDARRALLAPERPREALALRLLAAGLDRAALDLVEDGVTSDAGRALRRVVRCRVLLLDAARRGGSVAGERAAPWAEELLLLAGRRLPELVPGSGFLRAVDGGAAALERVVAEAPLAVAEMAALCLDHPELERPVATVLARVLGWPVGAVVDALRSRTLVARPDAALRGHLRGLALLDEGRPVEAAAEFESALALAPGWGAAAAALATARRAGGDADGGEGVLRALVDERPRDPEPFLHLARHLGAQGEPERARDVYERALGLFPHATPLRIAFAQELFAWGDAEAAIPHFERACREIPEEPRLLLLHGRALAAAERAAEATRVLARALPGLAGTDRSEAWYWLMSARRAQGDHATAERLARRLATALGPAQWALLDEVAEYLEERHDYARAREASERARRFRDQRDFR